MKLYTNPIIEQIKQQAKLQADKTAIDFNSRTISYAKMLERVDIMAVHMQKNGIAEGDRVGLGLERSEDLVVTMLAVWRCGAAFVPLDVDYPSFRLKQMVVDVQPSFIICDAASQSNEAWTDCSTLLFTDTGAEDTITEAVNKSSNMAYIIFTSGSTGKPKGVSISIVALNHFMTAMQQVLQFKSSDTWLAITAHSFDISILEIMLPLVHGGTLVLADKYVSSDGVHLLKLLQQSEANYLQATPATWQMMIDADWSGTNQLTAVCGGENFPRTLAEEMLPRCQRLFNAYGPTEATIWAMVEPVDHGTGPVPIGKPLNGYQAYVLNESHSAVDKGSIGQLFLAGVGLADGYFNQLIETDKYFIQHPELGRIYATGDLVKVNNEGKYEFAGRKDHQVKVRGHRIELGEIESRLLEMEAVSEAVVITHKDDLQHTKILAYLVFKANNEMSSESLRASLIERIPAYMMPNHFVPLKSLPLTMNKKIDRKNLPLPTVNQGDVDEVIDNPLELYLQSVWQEILGLDKIASTHDFFDMGGDSILAARITNRVQDWLGELLWPVIIFDAPTIAKMAHYLQQNYPDSVALKTDKIINSQTLNDTQDRVIDDALINQFNHLNPPMILQKNHQTKNPRAIFLLCPPRSGSTLLRVMLAGNQRIFAPPEVEMLTFNTLKERSQMFSGRESYRAEGLTRAIMEIKNCDVEQAKALLAELENQGQSIHQSYGLMQDWLGDKILLDKTPANCLDAVALNRIESMFDEPLYIHLTRHPYGMIRSFLEARLAEVFFRRVEHDFSARELAELIWYTCNNNIQSMLHNVPDSRQFTIGFEQLLAAPESHIQDLSLFLEIEYHTDMIKPHRNKDKKMTDGLHKESKMMGDPKFHQHKSIDASVAERWRTETPETALGIKTDQLAVSLGYQSTRQDDEEAREDFIL